MQLYFDSMTGNTRRFSQKLAAAAGVEAHDLKTVAPEEAYLLLTYTFGQGEVPASTSRFLSQHASGLRGVVSSGSFHWGERFARAGETIAEHYGVPLIAKLNKSGSEADFERVLEWLKANRG